MNTRELLGEYAALLNKYGADSHEAREHLEQHKEDREFYELAQLSSRLKRALTAPAMDSSASHDR